MKTVIFNAQSRMALVIFSVFISNFAKCNIIKKVIIHLKRTGRSWQFYSI